MGWSDAVTAVRLASLAGVAYPAPPRAVVVALLRPAPAADGSDGPLPLEDERVPMASVRYGPPRADAGSRYPHDWYCEPEQDHLVFNVPGNPAVAAHEDYQAWAVVDAFTGDVLYVGLKGTRAALGKRLTVPGHLLRVMAESPTA